MSRGMPRLFFVSKLWHDQNMKNIVLIFILSFLASNAFAARQLALKLVASVENKIVTSRDVEASYIVDRVLYREGPLGVIAVGTEEFKDALDHLLIESMVSSEASTFGVAKVTDSEIEQSFSEVKEKISGSAIKNRWASLSISDSQLKDIVAHKLRANRFIKYKSDSSYVQVSDEEARDYFNRNRLKFGTMQFEGFKANIKRYLAKKNAEERLKDWFDVLRKKHKVKKMI